MQILLILLILLQFLYSKCVTDEQCIDIRLNAAYWKDDDYDYYNDADSITNGLYLGNVCAAHNLTWLEKHHITLIVSIAREWPSYTCPDVQKVKQISYTLDDSQYEVEENAKDILEKGSLLIKNHIDNNIGNILVHCNMGISRSTSLVIRYLQLRYPKQSYRKLLAIVKNKRRVVKPNNLLGRILVVNDQSIIHNAL